MRRTEPFILHPFLFAVYPVLFLFSQNMDEVAFSELLRPIIIALVCATIGFAIFYLLLKNIYKAALLVTIAMLLFSLYFPVYLYTQGFRPGGFIIGRHRVLLIAWGLLFLTSTFLVAKVRAKLTGATAYLNAFAIILVSLALFNITVYEINGTRTVSTKHAWQKIVSNERKDAKTWMHPKEPVRDVYYIILDQYGRADILQKYMYYDNSPFINSLKKKGFYVADESLSRYTTTHKSLASSLNLDYLENMGKTMGVKEVGDSLCGEMILENKICHLFKDSGYTFVFFPSMWQVTGRNPYADKTFTLQRFNMSEFERVIFYNSPLQAIAAAPNAHRNQLLYAFQSLETVSKIKSPTFTFAHISCPHNPYVFDKNGNLPKQFSYARGAYSGKSVEEMRKRYLDQTTYLNKRMEEIIDKILADSEVEPIIIVQSDHGPPGRMAVRRQLYKTRKITEEYWDARHSVLNAYYLPDGGDKLLYPSVSPVNSFRLIFNYYFGAHYELHDDKSPNVDWKMLKYH